MTPTIDWTRLDLENSAGGRFSAVHLPQWAKNVLTYCVEDGVLSGSIFPEHVNQFVWDDQQKFLYVHHPHCAKCPWYTTDEGGNITDPLDENSLAIHVLNLLKVTERKMESWVSRAQLMPIHSDTGFWYAVISRKE